MLRRQYRPCPLRSSLGTLCGCDDSSSSLVLLQLSSFACSGWFQGLAPFQPTLAPSNSLWNLKLNLVELVWRPLDGYAGSAVSERPKNHVDFAGEPLVGTEPPVRLDCFPSHNVDKEHGVPLFPFFLSL